MSPGGHRAKRVIYELAVPFARFRPNCRRLIVRCGFEARGTHYGRKSEYRNLIGRDLRPGRLPGRRPLLARENVTATRYLAASISTNPFKRR